MKPNPPCPVEKVVVLLIGRVERPATRVRGGELNDAARLTNDVGPNITGSASFQNNVGLTNEKGIVTGAFTAGSEFPDTFSKVNGYGTSAIVFDASLADSTYGSSESVQPSSLKLLPCIKI